MRGRGAHGQPRMPGRGLVATSASPQREASVCSDSASDLSLSSADTAMGLPEGSSVFATADTPPASPPISAAARPARKTATRSTKGPSAAAEGLSFWTASEDARLLASVSRHGLVFKKVHKDFNLTSPSGQERSFRAINHRWHKLLTTRSKKRSPAEVKALMRAAKATPQYRMLNATSQDKEDALRKGLTKGKSLAQVYQGLEAKRRRSQAAGLSGVGAADEKSGASASEADEDDEDPTSKKNQWSKHDDNLLLATVADNRTNHILWKAVVIAFNRHSKLHRNVGAIMTRWYGLTKQGQQEPGWTSKEVQVLRESLAHHGASGALSSFAEVCKDFYKSMPRSKRSPEVLRLKCESLIASAKKDGQSSGTDIEGVGDEEEEDEVEKEQVGEKSDVGVYEEGADFAMEDISSAAQSRRWEGRPALSSGNQAQAQALDHAQAQAQVSIKVEQGSQVNEDSRVPSSSRRHSAARPRSPSRATPPRPSPLPRRAQQTQPSAALDVTTPLPSFRRRAPVPYGVTYLPSSVEVHGCIPGLEVMVFSPSCAKLFCDPSEAPTFSEEDAPAFHLRCLDGEGVLPEGLPLGATMRTEAVERVQGGKRGPAVQIVFTGLDGFEVVLRF